jgi:hypothetical protein
MSELFYPQQGNAAQYMRDNISLEDALALKDRLLDAEQVWRYFVKRDEMNAEVHLADGEFANVRFSPITIASERLAGYLSKLYYGEVVNYRTAIQPKD